MKKRILSVFIAAAVIFSLSAWLPFTTSASDTYPTPAGYNDNDYQKLVSFALQDDNLTKLGWTLDDLATWTGIRWNFEADKRVTEIYLNRANPEYPFDPVPVPDNIRLSGKLDVSDFTALESLIVSFNKLTEIDVSNNTKLTRLFVEGNHLTELDITNNAELTSLSVRENQLTELDVSNNIELGTLDVGSNQLAELDISNNTKLTILYVGGNQLTEFDVSNYTELTILNVGGNLFTEIDVSNNTALVWLIVMIVNSQRLMCQIIPRLSGYI